MFELDLTELTDNGRVPLIGGKDRGLETRKANNLDNIDQQIESGEIDGVTIIADEDKVMMVTPSFALGLLSASFHRLGKEVFLEHYHFKMAERVSSIILDSLDRVIEDQVRLRPAHGPSAAKKAVSALKEAI